MKRKLCQMGRADDRIRTNGRPRATGNANTGRRADGKDFVSDVSDRKSKHAPKRRNTRESSPRRKRSTLRKRRNTRESSPIRKNAPLFLFDGIVWETIQDLSADLLSVNRYNRAESFYALILFFLPLFLVVNGSFFLLSVLVKTYAFFSRSLQTYELSQKRALVQPNPWRHVIRTSLNPPPSPETLLSLWNRRKGSTEDAIAFGSALNDLEAYVNNRSIPTPDGHFRGRNPGIKGWLKDNCPEIHCHYQTALQLKRLAQRLRDASEMAQPCPPEWLLPHSTVPLHEASRMLQSHVPHFFRARYAPPGTSLAKRLSAEYRPGLVCDHVPTDFMKSRQLVETLLADYGDTPARLNRRVQFLLEYAI